MRLARTSDHQLFRTDSLGPPERVTEHHQLNDGRRDGRHLGEDRRRFGDQQATMAYGAEVRIRPMGRDAAADGPGRVDVGHTDVGLS